MTYGPYGIRVGRLRHAVTHAPDEWLPTTEPGLSTDSFSQASRFSVFGYYPELIQYRVLYLKTFIQDVFLIID